MKKNFLYPAVTAVVITVITFFSLKAITNHSNSGKVIIQKTDVAPAKNVLYTKDNKGGFAPLDFTNVSKSVMPAVVHIKSTSNNKNTRTRNPFGNREEMLREFFGDRFRMPQQGPRVGTGSGVIIDKSGYIVTNNHVIKGASEIEVTLHDNRTLKANIIGVDPTTDLALIKINAGKPLSTLAFMDSDKVEVGEWVLAVGNPFNLNSTVTAGIVSAKGRSINILQSQNAIESFIQTDAAINPGNSGGALVNMQGDLIGINTAIASPTGAYAGYGFAVPSNIVSKVVEDLIQHGTVQRGYLGISIRNVDANLVKEQDLKVNEGVFVGGVNENSAAIKAGLKPGDVIVKIDGRKVKDNAALLGTIARKRPGDKISLTVDRYGVKKSFDVVLKNKEGNTNIVKKSSAETLNKLGAEFEKVSSRKANELGISGGVRVTKILPGKIKRNTNMQEGFIITKVDGKKVKSIQEIEKILANKKDEGVMLEGMYEGEAGKYYYAFGL